MTGFNYIINLTTLNGGAFGKLASMAGGFENSLDRVQGEVDQTQSKLNNLGRTGQGVFSGMRSTVMSWVAGLGIGLATLGSLQAAAQNEGISKAIEFAGGADGARNLAHVRSEVDRLGLPLKESLDGFKTLSGAMMGTGLAADQQHKIFTGLAEGIATFRLPAEQANRALLALSQMASKGSVQSEELKGQLGEALPGAFGIAARSLGVTTGQLQKMLEKGEVLASDFLPKFATELHKTFGQSAVDAATGATANFNRFQTSIYDLRVEIGQRLLPTAISLIQNFLIPGAQWIGQNIDLIGGLVSVFGSLFIAAKSYAIITGIMSLVTGGFTGSIWGLNAALLANPVSWVVGAIVALGAAVVYAWNRFEGFRATMYGVWEVIRPVGVFLYTVFVGALKLAGYYIQYVWQQTEWLRKGLGYLMDAVFQAGQWLWEHLIKPFTILGKVVSLLEPLFSKAGSAIGQKFTDGWNKGLADFSGPGGSPAMAGALGVTGFSAPTVAGAAGKGAGKLTASTISDSITGGGQRNTTINVGNLNEGGITIHTTNLKEGASEVEAMFMKLMLQVVNSGNQQQGK